jgi:hypothetical protein
MSCPSELDCGVQFLERRLYMYKAMHRQVCGTGGVQWAVPQFSTLAGKIFSNTFVAAGHTW